MGSQECHKGVAVYAVWDRGVAVIKDLFSLKALEVSSLLGKWGFY